MDLISGDFFNKVLLLRCKKMVYDARNDYVHLLNYVTSLKVDHTLANSNAVRTARKGFNQPPLSFPAINKKCSFF